MKHTSFFAAIVLLFTLASGFANAEQPAIDINSADAATLSSLDGIGASKAEAIIVYRKANGPFETPEDLSNVKGIGSRTIEKNAERMTVK